MDRAQWLPDSRESAHRLTSISRTLLEDKDASVIYTEVKAQHPDNSAGKVSFKDEERYENEKLGECPTHVICPLSKAPGPVKSSWPLE
ncbi:hypothetical protein P7K49_037511 [Saguinus oedipus]|uniref:Uncharacterized protein n=1 Tax=Saguinus oedipus TaxID=9490 RepID=A0ABQ9TIB0_SAGOE|nr:hypothetical protein P7K49_037511 [Saguinus oedipus]